MITAFVLLAKVSQPSKPQKWKIPQEKKRFEIRIRFPTVPKNLLQRLMDAPPITYYKWMAAVALVGILGIVVQFKYTQYKLCSSEYNSAAKDIVMSHPKLVALIGAPLKFGYVFPSRKGSLQKDQVDVRVPITGQKSDGILSYRASKDNQHWTIKGMEFTFEDKAGGKVRLVTDSTRDI